ncbi:MAG TPA: hypothetical protein VHV31_17205, partial [Nitrolancea sp.]|nr:hypothetical protein [Nitrolancea sp.]
GLELLPLMAGLLITSMGSGILISRWGRYRIFPIVGTAVMTVGLYLLSLMGVHTGLGASSLYMFVLGIGIGGVMQVLVIAVQNVVPYEDLGVATSGATFFRSIGGSFGTAVFGAIFANELTGNLSHYLSGIQLPPGFNATAGASPAVLAQLPPAVHDGFVHAFSDSLHTVFLFAVPIAAVAFALTWLLQEVPLRQTTTVTNPADTLAPTSIPAARSSLDEINRALSVLVSGQGRTQIYQRLALRAGLDIDVRDCWMLLRLHDHPGGTLEELAGSLHIPSTYLAPLIEHLVEHGMIISDEVSNLDGLEGGSRFQLTDLGESAVQRLVMARREALAELVDDWSPDEHAELARFLTHMAQQLMADPAPVP